MANTIRHKRGTTTPGAGSLVTGELAINTSTGAVFTKTDAGDVVNIAGSATASWGGISGTLSSQTDLTSALALKANLAGATFTGLVNTVASTTTTAGIRLPHGVAPTTGLANGDVWTTTSGIFTRINGSSQQIALQGQTTTWTSGHTFAAPTLSLGTSTAASTYNLGTGATISGATKTLNIGTAGVAGSTTNIAIGSTTGTSTTTLNGTVNAPGLANGVKAWVNFNGTGTVAIRSSYNVSSITDNSAGNYTVNFTTALADANYAVSGFAAEAIFTVAITVGNFGTLTQTASAFRFNTTYGGTGYDCTQVHLSFFR